MGFINWKKIDLRWNAMIGRCLSCVCGAYESWCRDIFPAAVKKMHSPIHTHVDFIILKRCFYMNAVEPYKNREITSWFQNKHFTQCTFSFSLSFYAIDWVLSSLFNVALIFPIFKWKFLWTERLPPNVIIFNALRGCVLVVFIGFSSG